MFSRSAALKLFVAALGLSFFTGCLSAKFKQRKEQREKVAQASRLYCEFVNGDLYPDTDVQLNFEMAKRCDSTLPFSITQYRTSSDNSGIVYCCGINPAKAFAANKEEEKEKDSKETAPKK